ncbi:MAG: TGS domain-containing protein, partial [Rhodospirillaceae bacterium]
VRSFDKPVSGAELAADIGPGLAKAALAIRVDGKLKDLAAVIDADAQVAIVTDRDEEDALDLIRHDTAHVLAEAVQALFPGTQVTIGPNIENGFYYDFARAEPFSTEDLETIEVKMREIVDRDDPFVREVWDRDEAIKTFREMGEIYKAELIEGFPEGEEVGVYRQGQWFDLCRGPHMP